MIRITTSGYYNSLIRLKDFYVLSFLLVFQILGCKQGEESKVKETCNNFIDGRIALRTGDSLKLKSVTERSLFRLIKLNQEYVGILDAPIIRAELNIRTKSVEIKGNCATCLMSGEEYYTINLCKDGEEWKVKGESGIYPTPERIAEAKKKITDYNEFLKDKPARDSVMEVLTLFFNSTKPYFKNQELEPLKKICDEASLNFIQHLYSYADQRTGPDILNKEMEKQDFTPGDYKFDKDKVQFKFYGEETSIILHRVGNSYKITGFNGIDANDITDQIIKNQYLSFLRSLKLIRSEKYRSKEIK